MIKKEHPPTLTSFRGLHPRKRRALRRVQETVIPNF